MKNYIKIVFIVFTLFVLISCRKHDDSDQSPYEVRLEYKNFHPFQLLVPVGTTVTFSNRGGGSHSVSGTFFNSGRIKEGNTYSYTFNTVGTYFFSCFYHSDNREEQTTIIVE